MATAYSIRILQAQVSSGATAVSDAVPTGFIWLLNFVSINSRGYPFGYCQLLAPGDHLVANYDMYPLIGQAIQWRHDVLEAGEQLTFYNLYSLSDMDVLISGYQLSTT